MLVYKQGHQTALARCITLELSWELGSFGVQGAGEQTHMAVVSLQSGILNITLGVVLHKGSGNCARLPTMHVSEMWHFPLATCLLPCCRGEVSSGVDRWVCEDPLLLLQQRHGCSP